MSGLQRLGTLALALAAASAIALAGVGMPWWSSEQVSVVPTYLATCFGGDCERHALDGMGGGNWVRFGMTTWGAGLIAVGCLVVLAAAVASHRTGRLPAKIVLAAVLAASVSALAFVLGLPSEGKAAGLAIGPGVYLHFAGMLLGTSAALLVLLARRPAVAA